MGVKIPTIIFSYEISLIDKNINLFRHRMLAAMFIPIPKRLRDQGYQQENLVVNHIDGIKGHDEIDNLEWCTVKENMDHAILAGLIPYLGENSHFSKITNEQAHEICKLLSSGKRPKEVAALTGVTAKTIRHILLRTSWKQLSKDYEFPEFDGPVPYMYEDTVVHMICELIQEGNLNNREIGELTGTTQSYVGSIKNKTRRCDISDNYDFSQVPKRNPGKAKIARQICEDLQDGEMSMRKIANKYNVSYGMVTQIKNGYIWESVSKDYDFTVINEKISQRSSNTQKVS